MEQIENRYHDMHEHEQDLLREGKSIGLEFTDNKTETNFLSMLEKKNKLDETLLTEMKRKKILKDSVTVKKKMLKVQFKKKKANVKSNKLKHGRVFKKNELSK